MFEEGNSVTSLETVRGHLDGFILWVYHFQFLTIGMLTFVSKVYVSYDEVEIMYKHTVERVEGRKFRY